MTILQLVNLEWSSRKDMLAHYNKSNISSTTLQTEVNMRTILYLKDTTKERLLVRLLLKSSKLKVRYMKAGTMLILRKVNSQISDSIE
jgi:hypothetical protein